MWQPGVRQRASIRCRPPAPTMKRSRKAFWQKKRPSRSGWGKVEKTRRKRRSDSGDVQFSKSPTVHLHNWQSSERLLRRAHSAAHHHISWIESHKTQDTMRRTGNQRSPNNLDPRSSPSFNFLPNLSSSVCFPQLYPVRATLTVHFFAQSHPSHPMAPLYFKLRFFYSGFWSTAVHWVSALPLLFSFSSIVYQKNVFFSIIFYSFIFCWM